MNPNLWIGIFGGWTGTASTFLFILLTRGSVDYALFGIATTLALVTLFFMDSTTNRITKHVCVEESEKKVKKRLKAMK